MCLWGVVLVRVGRYAFGDFKSDRLDLEEIES